MFPSIRTIAIARRPMRALVFQHHVLNGPGPWADALELRGVDVEVARVDRDGVPEDAAEYDLLLALGGPQSACSPDPLPWVMAELRVLSDAVSRGMPVIGVCLGAQLLARAAGGCCQPGSRFELGVIAVETTPAGARDPLFASLAPRFPGLAFHGDTFALPPHATRLAGSAMYANQAFRCGPASYGLQFHLEPSNAEVAVWLRQPCVNRLPSLATVAQREAFLERHARHEPALHDAAARIAWRWLAAAEIQRSARSRRARPPVAAQPSLT